MGRRESFLLAAAPPRVDLLVEAEAAQSHPRAGNVKVQT